jgi:hypothetical protein
MGGAVCGRRTRFVYLDKLEALWIAGIIAAHTVMGYSTFGSWTYQDVQETTVSSAKRSRRRRDRRP